MKPKNIVLIICLMCVLSLTGCSVSKDTVKNTGNSNIVPGTSSNTGTAAVTEEEKNSNSVWLNGFTNLDDFDYYIDGTEIYLKRYNGDNEKVRIASTYTIDGTEMNVVSLKGAVFFCGDEESIIVPEGVTNIDSNAFNSSDVAFIYLPKTLTKVESTFWGYFHDVEKIYYGGTEEEWNKLCTVDREDVEAKQIICNTNPDDLK